MPIAEADLVVSGPIDDVFARFVHYPDYGQWMPSIMRPLKGPDRPFQQGDRFVVLLAGLPQVLKIERFVAGREICWSGGIPGIIFAAHSFFFDAIDAKSTRIRSVEPWSGILPNLPGFSNVLQKQASRVGKQQLRGFQRYYEANKR